MRPIILGATGTLGQEITTQLLNNGGIDEIVCFSRDELKQSEMKKRFKDDRLKFVLGDIRDQESLASHLRGIDTVFHVAALKQIDTLELNVEECIKTNVLGTINVANLCGAFGVKNLLFSSTDKAIDPINAYGMCKGLSERILIQKPFAKIFRWGNVIGSRGSVIHSFAKSLKEEGIAYITDYEMTRFWIKLQDAAEYMIQGIYYRNQEIYVPPMKAARVGRVIDSVARVLGIKNYVTEGIPIRPGEKIHESIYSLHSDDHENSQDAPQYSDVELDDLIGSVLCRP